VPEDAGFLDAEIRDAGRADSGFSDPVGEAGTDGARMERSLLDYSTANCTRPSPATYFDPATASLTRYAPDQPRVLRDGSLYLEGERTNLLGFSAELERGAVNQATVTPNALSAPDGPMTAEEWVARANPNAYLYRTSAPFGPGVFTLSIFARALTGIGEFRQYYQSPSETNRWSSVHLATPEWQRFSVTDSNMSRAGVWQTETAVSPLVFALYGLQVEPGPFPSSYIETPGATTETRAADDCTLASAPPRMLGDRWSVVIAPAGSSDDIASLNERWTIFGFAGDEDQLALIAERGKVHVVIEREGAVVMRTAELEFEAGQELTLTVDPLGQSLEARGATRGDGVVIGNSAPSFPSGTLYIGRGADDAGSFFGRLSPPTAR